MKKTIILLALLSSFKSYSQQAKDPFVLGSQLISTGNYLGAYDQIINMKHSLEPEDINGKKDKSPTLLDQAVATFGSFVGESYTLNWKKSRLRVKHEEQVHFTPALQYITEYCKNSTVVMINEDHNTPKHRLLTYNLLKNFYDLGFRYLAVEALEKDSSYKKLGFPQVKSGFYMGEPIMGDLLRRAIKLGFKLVPFESNDRTTYDGKSESYLDNIREINQAKNLAQIFQNDPGAKIVVHSGHGHIWEKGGDIIFMAEYFRILTGINPVTINQSINSMDEFKEKLDSTINLQKTDVPYIVLDQTNKPRISGGDKQGAYDLLVSWPTPQTIFGRNDFVFTKDGTVKYYINLRSQDQGKLLQVISLDMRNDIPYDQFIIKNNIKKYGISLEKGQYYIQIKDNLGQVVSKKKIKVE